MELDLVALTIAHIEAENIHSVPATMDTISADGAYYKVFSNNQTFTSRPDISVFYGDTMDGIPDMHVAVEHMIVDKEKREVFAQYLFTGTHTGTFQDLPPTGKPIMYHGGILYQFDENGKLTKEVQYFDKTEILASLGLIRDTNTTMGKFLLIFFQSPFYMIRAAFAMLFKKKKK